MRRNNSSKRIAIIAVAAVVGVSAFYAYFAVEAAKSMDVSMHDYTVISKNDEQTKYNAKIQFKNTSFVPLTIGDTSYNVNVNGEYMGTGTIKPFIIGPYSTMPVDSEFTAKNVVLDRYGGEIPYERMRLTGTSNYNLYLTAFDVPFSHNPTEEQVKKFTNK